VIQQTEQRRSSQRRWSLSLGVYYWFGPNMTGDEWVIALIGLAIIFLIGILYAWLNS
jgi:hypothetical protein